MLELIVENKYGQKLNLTGNRNYTVTPVTGLTQSTAVINRSTIATQHGSKFNSSRKGERFITFIVYPERDIEKSRLNLYKYIRTGEYVKLYLKNNSRAVWIEGHAEVVEGDLYAQKQQINVSIICEDPFFKAVDKAVESFAVVEGEFTFPFSISEEGTVISTYYTYREKDIVNESDEEIGCVVDVTAIGDAVKPTIYNNTTEEAFTVNHEFILGDIVRIDTRSGKKSVTLIRDGESINILNKTERSNKWIKLLPGVNTFGYYAMGGTECLQIKVTMQTVYGGI